MNLREKCKQLRAVLEAALIQVSKNVGLNVTVEGSMSYDPSAGTVKVKLLAVAPNEKGEIESVEAKDFKSACCRYGLKPEDLGKTFRFRNETYTLTGAKPRSSRFPLLGKRSDGKVFKFAADDVARQLNPNPPTLKVTTRASSGPRTKEEILDELRAVENQLSPEWLSADGERSVSAIRRLSAQLNAKRRRLVAELGREPTTEELYPQLNKSR